MNKLIKANATKFNALTLRERILFGLTLIVVTGIGWWHFYAEPVAAKILVLTEENQKIGRDIQSTRLTIQTIRNRIDAGVSKHKEQQIASLKQALKDVEERLRLKTVELIDPEDMFRLMSQLIYQESRLKLLSFKRLEVIPAITPTQNQAQDQQQETGIFRHIIEVRFSGKYLDILKYMESLEAIDWKLIWEKIEIVSNGYPDIIVKVVISTLSTRKEWVGV